MGPSGIRTPIQVERFAYTAASVAADYAREIRELGATTHVAAPDRLELRFADQATAQLAHTAMNDSLEGVRLIPTDANGIAAQGAGADPADAKAFLERMSRVEAIEEWSAGGYSGLKMQTLDSLKPYDLSADQIGGKPMQFSASYSTAATEVADPLASMRIRYVDGTTESLPVVPVQRSAHKVDANSLDDALRQLWREGQMPTADRHGDAVLVQQGDDYLIARSEQFHEFGSDAPIPAPSIDQGMYGGIPWDAVSYEARDGGVRAVMGRNYMAELPPEAT